MKIKDKQKPEARSRESELPELPARPPGVQMLVKRALVRLDPDQPRKTFNQQSLVEMSDSIRENGIIQPLIVEFVKALNKIHEPDLTSDGMWYSTGPDGKEIERGREVVIRCTPFLVDYYEVICGERRFRGAALAGLDELPCIVHENVTERERRVWQFVENCQRENVSTLEEAMAIQDQLVNRQESDAKFSPEKLATELGISRAALYERLKLTRLSEPVKEALRSGKVSASVAGVVATLPTPKDQESCLKKIMDEKDYHFPWSVRDVQSMIDGYMRQLDDAPFDRKRDDYFGPQAQQTIACQGCPARTGNMLAEFPNLKTRPNVCTNPKCFQVKSAAHYLESANALRKNHEIVELSALRARPEKHVAGETRQWAKNRNGTTEELMGNYAPKAIIAYDDNGVYRYYKVEDFNAAAKKNKVEFYEEAESVPAAELSPEERKKAQAKAKAEEERQRRMDGFPLTKLPDLARSLAGMKGADAWELLLQYSEQFNGGDQDSDFEKVLVDRAKTPQAKVLGILFSSYDMDPLSGDDWDKDVLAGWKLAGVDLKAEFEAAEKAAQTVLPLPAKSKSKQGDLLAGKAKMTPQAKAKIVAASRARWAKVQGAKK